tara:strand:+ start:127 stop:396 length:270 start_codon:yes stop_codon:yes gene_type:complete
MDESETQNNVINVQKNEIDKLKNNVDTLKMKLVEYDKALAMFRPDMVRKQHGSETQAIHHHQEQHEIQGQAPNNSHRNRRSMPPGFEVL